MAEFSGRLIRLYLATLHEVSQQEYAHILHQAGWDRFLAALPPDTDAPLLTEAESQQMDQVCYAMLGEDLYRLFTRNIGVKTAQALLASPWGAALRAQVAQAPPAARPRRALDALAQFYQAGGVQMLVGEDARAWYLTLPDCPTCTGLQGARAPLCATASVGVKMILDQTGGPRYRVDETACRAMGAPACVYTIPRP
ncbi:MAG TPA: 4-vinyl reductase [Chloroflexia bacterium]|nr:4-vinyl reductase [Chloroflexia bacterium]